MSAHKATPQQWEATENWAIEGDGPTASCLIELRDRIAALEAAANRQAILDSSPVPADPRISLVATVDQAMFDARNETTHEAACAVIDAVACWLDSQNVGAAHAAARWLREEVERHG
jgi:hypothetical protein